MATPRNVWLPGAAVWACLPPSSQLLSSPARDQVCLKGQNARSDDQLSRKRRKSLSPHASSNFASNYENKPESFADMDAEVGAPGLGLTIDSKEVSICPICLCHIEEAGGVVLQWCMHQFCAHCIEEWSRVRRLCPLCKAEYRGWYCDVRSNNKFQERILPPAAELNTLGDMAASHALLSFHERRDTRRQERGRGSLPRRRQGVAPGTAAARGSGRSIPFPTQRSFGLPNDYQGAQAMRILEEQAAAKTLEWRKSIYERNLIARPFDLRRRSTGIKDKRAERRLEPWVCRELQAVLPNADHDFLVRLVLGLWFGTEHEAILRPERPEISCGPSTRHVTGSTEVEDASGKAIKELKRFLGDKAEVFWHELRCFAESPFTMRAYDTVVVYSRHDNSRRPIVKVDRRSSRRDRSSRGAEPALSMSTSMPLHNEGPAHRQNDHYILPIGRHRISRSCATEGVHGNSEQQQQFSCIDSSQALLKRSRADLRKRRQYIDVIPIAEDRWQLSNC